MKNLFLTSLIIATTSGILLRDDTNKVAEFKEIEAEHANKIPREVSLDNPDENKNYELSAKEIVEATEKAEQHVKSTSKEDMDTPKEQGHTLNQKDPETEAKWVPRYTPPDGNYKVVGKVPYLMYPGHNMDDVRKEYGEQKPETESE